MPLYLPNKNGHYHETEIPKYMQDVFFHDVFRNGRLVRREPRIVEIGHNFYRIYGYKPWRSEYGIRSDFEKLQKWCARYFTEVELVRYHTERKNYYVDFRMYDPVAYALEKAGMIQLKNS